MRATYKHSMDGMGKHDYFWGAGKVHVSIKCLTNLGCVMRMIRKGM